MSTQLPVPAPYPPQRIARISSLVKFQHRKFYPGTSYQACLLGLLITLLTGLDQLRAQCPAGPVVTLSTQAQINTFAIQYSNCTNLPAQLLISGPDITNLNPLSLLRTIGNSLTIQNNPQLRSLAPLSSLTAVGGSIVIANNASLISLGGLNNTTSIGNSLTIQDNAQLASIEALSNVASALTSLYIANNASLISLSGLNKISSVSNLTISTCPQLTSLAGLTSLTSLTGTSPGFVITGNTKLTSLRDVAGLTAIGQNTNVLIQNNSSLRSCAISALCQRLALNTNAQTAVNTNATGCNSVAEVLSACSGTDIGIITQPPSQSTILAGTDLSVPVSATGNITAYQWYKDNLPVENQTRDTLGMASVQTSQAGSYFVVVSSPSTSLTSTAFTLNVTTQPIRYVKADGSGDGSSWATASGDLQAMIDADGTQQVWVAAGTYRPISTYSMDVNFSMKNGVSILGGFPASGNPTLSVRSPASYSTILSSYYFGSPTRHIIRNFPGLTASAVLDGFILTGGYALDEVVPISLGGAIYNNGTGGVCSPTIRNCVFINNVAVVGGAIYNDGSHGGNSSPQLINCSFINNSADIGFNIVVAYGGAICNDGSYNGNSTPQLINCSFMNNSAFYGGGAIFNEGSFSGNSSPSLINCSFLNNSASYGGAFYNTNSLGGRSHLQLINCIFFNNGGDNTILNGLFNVSASYSLFEPTVTGYISGPGNLTTVTTSPFASSANTQLATGSPAINTGNTDAYTAVSGPATDLAGNVRIQNGTIDMGAYELGLPSDLTTVLYAQPSTVNSTTPISLVVDVFELNVAPTSGLITVYITKDPLLTLSFDPTATCIGARPVQNSSWRIDALSNPTAYVLTTTQTTGVSGKLSVGLQGQLAPGNTKGNLSISAVVEGSAVGELQVRNNADAEKIDYFNK